MNIQLHHVIRDVTDVAGMQIIRAISEGVRDPKVLARYRDGRCKNSIEVIEKSLEGNYQPEHIFALKQALELYEVYQSKIKECDQEIEKVLSELENQVSAEGRDQPPVRKASEGRSGNAPDFDLHSHLYRLTGVNLGILPGMNSYTVLLR